MYLTLTVKYDLLTWTDKN